MYKKTTTSVRANAAERWYRKAMKILTSQGGTYSEIMEHLEKAAEGNHPGALTLLACLHGNSIYVTIDRAKEAEYLRRAADSGYAEAQAMLAYFYFTGRFGLKIDRMKAAYLLKQALQQDSSFAKGVAYITGLCKYKRDLEEARRIFVELSEKILLNYAKLLYCYCVKELYNSDVWEYEDEDAMLYMNMLGLGISSTSNYYGSATFENTCNFEHIESALAQLETSSNSGDPESMYLLGSNLLKYGREKDGLPWLEKSAKLNYGPAILRFALYNFEKKADLPASLSENYELRKDLILDLEKAASFGESKALTAMGAVLEESDPAGAAVCYFKGSLEQNPESLYKLGKMYLTGVGNERTNPEAGIALLREACELGCAQAHVPLGEAYLQGLGVPKDTFAALGHFHAAAMKGVTGGMFQYGKILVEGTGGFADMETGLKYLERAVELKDPQAMQYYWIHIFGILEVENHIDPEKYMEVLKACVLSGDPAALVQYGVELQTGNRITPDLTKAFECFSLAEKLGNSDGSYHLGCMWQEGIGVKKNPAKAKECFLRAIEQGNHLAQFEYGQILCQEGEELAGSHLLQCASDNGLDTASSELADLYSRKDGAVKDLKLEAKYRRAHWLRYKEIYQNNKFEKARILEKESPTRSVFDDYKQSTDNYYNVIKDRNAYEYEFRGAGSCFDFDDDFDDDEV